MELIIGIDGGATKTDFVLCSEKGKVLNRVLMQGCNPNDIGFENAELVLYDGLSKLLKCYGGMSAPIRSLFAGISGGSTGNNRFILNDSFRHMLPNAAVVTNHSDAINAISSEIPSGNGCVVIAGTGTVGYYRDGENISRVGGWGYLLDKGGSGYDFGRDAIYYALAAYDHREPQTIITSLIEEQLCGDIPTLLPEIYKRGKAFIASFATVVFDAYHQGDQIASRIMEDNMKELSKLFNVLGDMAKHRKVVLVGSIFKQFELLKPLLTQYLKYEFDFIIPANQPIYGSIVEAFRAAEIHMNAEAANNFESQLNQFKV